MVEIKVSTNKNPKCNCCGPIIMNVLEKNDEFIIYWCPVCGHIGIDRQPSSDYVKQKEKLEKALTYLMEGIIC